MILWTDLSDGIWKTVTNENLMNCYLQVFPVNPGMQPQHYRTSETFRLNKNCNKTFNDQRRSKQTVRTGKNKAGRALQLRPLFEDPVSSRVAANL